MVVSFADCTSLWFECNTAFRQHLGKSAPGSRHNYTYDGDDCHVRRGSGSWFAGVSDIGRKDVVNLLSLTRSDGRYVGVLLLAFDRVCARTNDDSTHYCPLPGYGTPAHGSAEGLVGPITTHRGRNSDFGNACGLVPSVAG